MGAWRPKNGGQITMNRRLFLGGFGAGLVFVPTAGIACQSTWHQCDAMPDNSFRRGTVDRPPDCVLEFHLPAELLTRRGIVRADGTYEWTFRLITFEQAGRPRWQQAHRVVDSPVRRQGVYFGTVGATYITCDEFTGWYATDPIRSCGQLALRPVNWPFDWQQLERMTR